MRRGLVSHQYDILVVKDFSRFSRRNSRGLVELEDLRDAGVRIISIGDGIDFPNDDDWLKIQFQFLINEMPVTDTSKKVKNVIRRRQADGQWLCAAPYGYLLNKRKEFEIIPTEAEIVRTIFHLYNDQGWGYKKIANYLTNQGIPTPRMSEQLRKEADGESSCRKTKAAWAIVTVQGILDNDFYIGTLRQGKYTRTKINGKDVRQDEGARIVIENHHQAIIDYRTFATTRVLREKRSTANYRGVKKYDNVYSGFLFCGDCGSPMFAMSHKDLSPAYTCGTYHRRGRSGCTSHHIRVDRLDELLKLYVKKIKENSHSMLDQLNADLEREQEDVTQTEQSADRLAEVLLDLQEDLKATKRQRIQDIMKHPEQEALLEETYDEMESELQNKIQGISRQIDMLADRRNTILQINRVAKTAMDVFQDILDKLGQYFSAISNEANLREKQFGWMILGVSEKGEKHPVGTAFKQGPRSNLENLKYEIGLNTTDGISFIDIIEIYPEYEEKKHRVLMFKIPAAAAGLPTAWRAHYYARSGESLVPLQQYKIDQIRSQERRDWSKQFVEGATIDCLDPGAIKLAREKYKEKMRKDHITAEVDAMTDAQFLEKRKLVIGGKVTNAAMLLLGSADYDHIFKSAPTMMWRLYGNDGTVKDYAIIGIPFISASDQVFTRIRNLTYRYMPDQLSLFPKEIQQYDSWLLRELLNNCIA